MRAEPLLPARVYRFYRGGALIGRLRDEPEEDGSFPEDWIGSVTAAKNPGRDDPEAGLSRLADGRLLRQVVEADPNAWLGEVHVTRFGTSTGLLVKLLDAAERLPVHAHPDRPFAREAFDSPFGKTEAWIVLDTRDEEAEVWVGLREHVEPERYLGWIVEQDVERLLGTLNRMAVRPGDVVYVPAGVPHAIGAGLLIAELQEPTDLSLVCEWRGFPIRPEDSHLGIGWDVAVHALDLSAHVPMRASRTRRARSSGPTDCSSRADGSRSCSSSAEKARSTALPRVRARRSRFRRRSRTFASKAISRCCAASLPIRAARRPAGRRTARPGGHSACTRRGRAPRRSPGRRAA